MKKITLLLLAIIVLSCSSDDSAPADAGFMKVLFIGNSNTPGQPVVYTIGYGTKLNEDQVFTTVSQEVYEYYNQKYQESMPNNPRWRGMITEDPD